MTEPEWLFYCRMTAGALSAVDFPEQLGPNQTMYWKQRFKEHEASKRRVNT